MAKFEEQDFKAMPMYDVVCKKLFFENIHLLKDFVCTVLNLNPKQIDDIHIENPEMPPSDIVEKFPVVDIFMIINKTKVHIEFQIARQAYFSKRVLYYWAVLHGKNLQSGKEYTDVIKTITICLVDFNFQDYVPDYHTAYDVREQTRFFKVFEDLEIHMIELPKLPKTLEVGNKLLEWMELFNIKNRDMLNEFLSSNTNENVKEAAKKIASYDMDEEIRRMIEAREKAFRDYVTNVAYAEEKGKEIGREEGIKIGEKKTKERMKKKLIAMGLSLEEIEKMLNDV